jgi:hypothetical protein
VNKASPSDHDAAVGDESNLSPKDTLHLIAVQRESVARSLRVDPALILAAWGLAWLIGFGVIYLAAKGRLGFFNAPWLAYALAGILFAAAAIFTFGAQIRRGRGVRGPSQRVAAMYGWSWGLAFIGVLALGLALEHQGLSSDMAPLLWTGSSLLAVGLLYLAGGMLWDDRLQYGLGVWVLVIGAASVAAGVSTNFAVLSLAGGGGFLVAAATFRARGWRLETASA